LGEAGLQANGSTKTVSPYSFFFSHSRSTNELPAALDNILSLVPPRHLAERLGKTYFDVLNFLHVLIQPEQWADLVDAIYSPGAGDLSADRVAVFFAVIGLGGSLLGGQDSPTFKNAAIRHMELAMQALVIADFLSSPTVEVVRTLALLNQYVKCDAKRARSHAE
jgi:hypothetical protein